MRNEGITCEKFMLFVSQTEAKIMRNGLFRFHFACIGKKFNENGTPYPWAGDFRWKNHCSGGFPHLGAVIPGWKPFSPMDSSSKSCNSPVGITSTPGIPFQASSNSRRNNHSYSGFLVQDLVIPTRITLLWRGYKTGNRSGAYSTLIIAFMISCAPILGFHMPNCDTVRRNKNSSGRLWFQDQ
jgi:hypothetical protein